MEAKFRSQLTKHFPFLKKSKSLLAISGGIDSVVLAYLCKNAGLSFALAHCNFNLRGNESLEDELFVRKLAEKLNVPIFVQHFQTKEFAETEKLSTQLAARKLRYTWFYKLVEEKQFNYILTAHHVNDSLETFLINTTRGTGLDGLTGIPTQSGKVIRPLSYVTQKEIIHYADTHKIFWREDSSNTTDNYFRNKLRHHVVPLLEEENPKLLKSFLNTQHYLQETADLLEDYTAILYAKLVKKTGDGYELAVEALKNTPHTKAVLYRLLSPFGFTAWDDIYHLLFAETGKQVFSSTHRLVKHRDTLVLTTIKENCEQIYTVEAGKNELQFPGGKLMFEEVDKIEEKNKEIAYLSAEKLNYPLTVRKWKAGDTFRPFGMKGTKKISDFLKDEKCSLIEKENTWVLYSERKIVWVIGHRIDDFFKIENQTLQHLKISLTP